MTTERRGPAPRAAEGISIPRPLGLGILFGVSTGLYAVTLAGVAVLQDSSDRAAVAAQADEVAVLDAIRGRNEELAGQLGALGEFEQQSLGSYRSIALEIEAVQARLAALAGLVEETSGAAAQLPTRISVPNLTGGTVRVAPPATHATTGASG